MSRTKRTTSLLLALALGTLAACNSTDHEGRGNGDVSAGPTIAPIDPSGSPTTGPDGATIPPGNGATTVPPTGAATTPGGSPATTRPGRHRGRAAPPPAGGDQRPDAS